MKFKINKHNILNVLSRVQGITSRKSNLAITENILIQSRDDKIFIAATDLETGFEGTYVSEIESDGTITINSKKIYEIVKNFPSDEISVEEMDNKILKIGNETVLYNILGMNANDFPELPQIHNDITFLNINSYDLRQMIEKTIMIHASGDEKRAHIIGVKLEFLKEDNTPVLRMISTDGKRLSKADCTDIQNNLDISEKDTVLIPKKGLQEVAKFLESEGKIKIGVKNNNFIVKKENETILINLLEGNFPEYGDIFSAGDDKIVEVEKEAFKMMLKRMSILTSDDYKGVIFRFEDNKLTIRAANPDLGESKEDMVIKFKSTPIEVAFNPQFFIDTLNFIYTDQILLKIIDDEHPCFIQGENDNSFISVIMPMKI
ncbi:MAG: DNA polymerase III subunit beta [Desulfobacteraceae bacterium]|nr:MAG: DNA polymerase III subunit beta [Desulfobacteraceae bacterium]